MAIASIFVLQSSWFVAWMTFDQRRIDDQRDGFIPCIKHRSWQPSVFSQKDWGRFFMGKVAHLLRYRIVQAGVLFVTAACLGVGVWGTLQIRVEFDPILLLPADSYLRQWITINNDHFPRNGWKATVFSGPLDYDVAEFEKMDHMIARLDKTVEEEWFLTGMAFFAAAPAISASSCARTSFAKLESIPLSCC